MARSSGTKDVLHNILGNLAYFLTELHESDMGAIPNPAERATAYITEALSIAPPDELPRLRDTEGAVLIAFGRTESEIKRGLELCKEARSNNPHKEIADLFCQLHERRAFRRILALG